MEPTVLLVILLTGAFVVTIPFGIWRARTKKFSVTWFLAIHLPIPAIFLLRSELGFSALWIPAVIVASVAGQVLGARIIPTQGQKGSVLP